MQLGKLKENCLLLKLYRKTQKNVSEPQKGIDIRTYKDCCMLLNGS